MGRLTRRPLLSIFGTILLLAAHCVHSQPINQCGPLDNAYGPFDYTNEEHFKERLPVVEQAHFTTEVETLQGHNKCGGNVCAVAGDLDYTLRAFPNHHRALVAMVQYHRQGLDKSHRIMRYTPNCYFDRALRFRPDDSIVYMIFGYYLSKTGDSKGAIDQFDKALELAPNSAEAHYNAGLLYTNQEDYVRARYHAKRAYELGFPLPGLRRKLERAGEWQSEDSALPIANQQSPDQ